LCYFHQDVYGCFFIGAFELFTFNLGDDDVRRFTGRAPRNAARQRRSADSFCDSSCFADAD
ncbi:hypothetical protein HAX54_027308, partial [Datura stramonium]|nr:hypothetical protein [Datura stramonium]